MGLRCALHRYRRHPYPTLHFNVPRRKLGRRGNPERWGILRKFDPASCLQRMSTFTLAFSMSAKESMPLPSTPAKVTPVPL